jgi:hypothetical protein
MNWKQYQNELIVLLAFVVMLGAYFYKHNQVSAQASSAQSTQKSIEELKEVVALKKVWADKKIKTKVAKIKSLIPSQKVKWNQQATKVTASYKTLGPNELNKLTTKVLNLPVEIERFEVKKSGESYDVEFKCKW